MLFINLKVNGEKKIRQEHIIWGNVGMEAGGKTAIFSKEQLYNNLIL